jgi:hypothetical protein
VVGCAQNLSHYSGNVSAKARLSHRGELVDARWALLGEALTPC